MSQVVIEQMSPIMSFKSKFESARKSERDRPNLKVEHYMVRWTIENLKQVVPVDLFRLLSPTFMLDSSRTEWWIEMDSRFMSESQGAVCFLLHRTDKRSEVGLTCRFGISKTDGGGSNITWQKEGYKTRKFVSGSHCIASMDACERNAFVRNMADYGERMTVICEMYITHEIPHYGDELLTPEDHDLINFAFDFSKLINSLESADYCVQASKNSIRVHRAILAARSVIFEDLVKKPRFKSSIKFDDVSFENLLAVLNYMYSGNLSKALSGQPSIGFYECAKKFAVPDLESFLSAKVVQVRSTLRTHSVKFTWHVNNFSLQVRDSLDDNPAVIISPKFGSVCFDSERLLLVMCFFKSQDLLSIYAEVGGKIKSVHSVLKISLINRNNELINTKISDKFGRLNKVFGFPYFLENFSEQDNNLGLVVDDTLRVQCQILSTVSSDFVESHSSSASGNVHVLESYRDLSAHMFLLMSKQELSEVAVRTSDHQIYPVHKPVLFARSGAFRSKFLHCKNKNDQFIDVLEFHPNIVLQMIRHAYMGWLKPVIDYKDLFVLCHASKKYVFRDLNLITLHYLASRLSVESFFLLYAESRNLSSDYLSAVCEGFARKNTKMIVEAANWQLWRQQEPKIRASLIDLLRTMKSTAGT